MARLVLRLLSHIAHDHGFVFEQHGPQNYILSSSDYAPGVVGEYESIREAWKDVRKLIQHQNPLANVPLPVVPLPSAGTDARRGDPQDTRATRAAMSVCRELREGNIPGLGRAGSLIFPEEARAYIAEIIKKEIG